jgi:Flp pilus assembly protein TadD
MWLSLIACVVPSLGSSGQQEYKRAVELFQKGDSAGAIEALKHATSLEPTNAVYWKSLGVVYAATYAYAAADEPFSKACRLDPRLPDACYYYGLNLYSLDRFDESIAPLQKALESGIKRWQVHVAIARSHEAQGRPREAARSFDSAVRREADARSREEPEAGECPRVAYGLFLFRQGDSSAARAMLHAAVAEHPDSAAGHFELGRVLHHLNELESAAAHLSRAVEHGYGAPAHLLLGKTYLRMGKAAEAHKHLQAGRAKAQ